MTSAVAKYAANKLLSKEMKKYKDKKPAGEYDPYYVEIPHPTKPGKTKKVKKQIPSYIPEADALRLAKARKRAYRLDYGLFNFCGQRFGWSSVIGLVPAAGDGLDGLFAGTHAFHMRKTEKGYLPWYLLLAMALNIGIDFLVGLVPFLGDLADAWVKCNGKNLRIFENHLDKLYMTEAVEAEHKNLPEKLRPRPASVYVEASDDDDYKGSSFDDAHDNVRQPTRTYSATRTRIPDEEMGIPRQETGVSRHQQPLRNGQGTRSGRR